MKCFSCGECCNQPVEVTTEELELMKQAGTPEQNSRLREVMDMRREIVSLIGSPIQEELAA
jgi:hypothetical protein